MKKLAFSLSALLVALLVGSFALAGEAAVKFTKKPTAKKAGDKVKIEFAVDRSTDVTVTVLNAKGEAVRRLAAGVLGGKKPPPAPLKTGLSQSLEWDGKDDYGKKVTGGPFSVTFEIFATLKQPS